ncbi:MAG TPA: hypothetical protein VM260_24390 [Pirellula sp.]|nr:hypothetical protein [Pirellula sp.]
MNPKPTSELLLPGEDLVLQGLNDLQANMMTEHALLLLIAGPRLRPLGLQLPQVTSAQSFEHQLYNLLSQRLGDAAHSHYNSLLRRIDSYAHALEREQGTARR